ncbi:MAG: DUF4230 domain-containing protein [Saprospiraceae bacterium]|uniref:DUF4230 domain-containing protein n=1 Tax=Candidatus Opimibacter skivensis TaxID=2982028 RepID=A0A9D7SW78_9BACT|nr:DUF4230 domain-containing protein [Candidatus Opimibacter skivensis]
MRGLRAWIWVFLAAAALFLAFQLGSKFSFPKTKTSEDSVVLLEKIRTVCKLVTAEGEFSEIYSYKESKWFDVSFLSKKALIRVKAKVSVGYDLSKIKVEPDEKSHTLVISGMPPAEILSVDHDLDYYDLSEGFFNSFSTEDYNKINADAKDFVISQVKKSSLMQAADKKRDELINVIRFMAEASGWKILLLNQGIADQKLN